MTEFVAGLNLMVAWAWFLLGTVLGLTLGTFFHKEDWLGGYGSFRRRLYRLNCRTKSRWSATGCH